MRRFTKIRLFDDHGKDFCKCDSTWYMIVVDYYSRWFEIFVVTSMTEEAIISKLKELFHDMAYRKKLEVTSSPHWPQSNGSVERAVKTAKLTIKKNKNDDLYLALLAYRSTPLECGFSPSELLFNRKLRSNLPQLPSLLEKQVNVNMCKSKEIKHKQVSCYNKRHNAKDMSPLKFGDSVWVVDIRKYGKVIEICPLPRSYIIQTELGKYRCNRWHLIYAPYHFPNSATHTEELECLDNNSEVRSAGTSEEFTNSQCQGLCMRNKIEGGKRVCRYWVLTCDRSDLLDENLSQFYNKYRIRSEHFEHYMFTNIQERTRLLDSAVPIRHEVSGESEGGDCQQLSKQAGPSTLTALDSRSAAPPSKKDSGKFGH
nr:unnamed protein product [Callosobruchus analis]